MKDFSRNYILVFFAFFASILMLSTSCMARPLQEKANMESMKAVEEKIIEKVFSLFTKFEDNIEIKSLTSFLEDKKLKDLDKEDLMKCLSTESSESEIMASLEEYVETSEAEPTFILLIMLLILLLLDKLEELIDFLIELIQKISDAIYYYVTIILAIIYAICYAWFFVFVFLWNAIKEIIQRILDPFSAA